MSKVRFIHFSLTASHKMSLSALSFTVSELEASTIHVTFHPLPTLRSTFQPLPLPLPKKLLMQEKWKK